ncbi:MAG: hypothetical protein JO117_00145 [Verrucomicrobia bacterium]|nr:hypothetical protein [Verrucomicrobiota bacterium]MBV9656658.1 hypothetical protein [Verrucomicrobiota bacterium]
MKLLLNMPVFSRPSLAFVTALSLLCVAPVRAETKDIGGNPPQKIDVSKLRTQVEDVVIPVPSEVFKALDKLGTPPWASEVRVNEKGSTPSVRTHLSLLFGTVVADGFLAVQAKDADKVKKIGRRVLELATALGVRSNVISHTQSIIEAADKGDWNEVRTELDKTQGEVKSAMEQLKDRDYSELVSIGGWLRGTEALTSIVRKDYNADRAELLHQPDLLLTFDRQLNSMNDRTRRDALVAKLQSGLAEIRPLIANADADINKDTVERINGITSDLVRAISPMSATSTP